MVALLLRHAVNVPHMAPNWEDTLPPSHWISADDRVDCLELESDILRRATGLVVELEPALLGDLLEVRLGKGPRQPLKELLVWLADAVVDLIARSPERVWFQSALPSLETMDWKPLSDRAWSHSPPPVSGSSTRRSEV